MYSLGTDGLPAQQRGEPRLEFVLRGRPQGHLQLRVVAQDVDIRRVRLRIVCALDTAPSEVGDQGPVVGSVALGLVDQAAGLFVYVAVR